MAATKAHATQGKENRSRVEEYFLYHNKTTFSEAGRKIGLSRTAVKKHYFKLIADGCL